ncbi:hypothetical protein [Micromonospora globbae]|uniref:hypothetical protein n=1 Tax=Micromonospora globbae TaxID=1894969 RepID=UPI00342C21C2
MPASTPAPRSDPALGGAAAQPNAVRADHGLPLIDVNRWVEARVGAEHRQLTWSLRQMSTVAPLDGAHPRMGWGTIAVAWCTARGYPVADAAPLVHDSPRLSAPVAIVLAYADRHGAIAIVSVDHAPPTVYADATTERGYWYDTDTIQLTCPTGHRFTWRGDGTLLDEGERQIHRGLPADQPAAPLPPSPDGHVVSCPRCGARCRLDLPEVPRSPDQDADIEVAWEITEVFHDRFATADLRAAIENEDDEHSNDGGDPAHPTPGGPDGGFDLDALLGCADGDLDSLLADREHPDTSTAVTERHVIEVRRIRPPASPAGSGGGRGA